MTMKTIYCFGSDIIEGDAIAFDAADSISDSIEGIRFVKIKDPTELYGMKLDDIIIMDAVKGIYFVNVFEDLSKLKSNNPVSAHDFDLSMFLQLMQTMGNIKQVKIIGLPYGKPLAEIKDDIVATIKREIK